MTRIEAREVLGIQKRGPDYVWFNLKLNGVPNLQVYDNDVTWEVDDTLEKAVAYVYDYAEGNAMAGKVRIVGPPVQIRNLLVNLGEGPPDEAIGPRWEIEKEDEPASF